MALQATACIENSITLYSTHPLKLLCREGDVIAVYDGRPNGELFLATGTVEDQNPADSLFMTAELVKADRMYTAKKSIVENLGFSTSEVILQTSVSEKSSPLNPWSNSTVSLRQTFCP